MKIEIIHQSTSRMETGSTVKMLCVYVMFNFNLIYIKCHIFNFKTFQFISAYFYSSIIKSI